MRLLTYDKPGRLYVTRDLADDVIPKYAILSHTWGHDEEEVTFHEVQDKSSRQKVGYNKIEFCQRQAQLDGLKHFWVDTCCIDKTNHVELSKAITCMYRWYENAQVCYVYLSDVSVKQSEYNITSGLHLSKRPWEPSFRKSWWFTRGWTLQELLAPKDVIFYSQEGLRLGTKVELSNLLHEITSIPKLALDGQLLSHFSVTERMRWSQGRKTKEKEDQAYCLLGIFNVFIPLIYGEGDHAFVRLNEAIDKDPKAFSFLKVVDGATFDAYNQAQQGCHPATRVDLLQSIQAWTRNVEGKSIFWLNGAAGTGKSTISWTICKWLSSLAPSDSVALGASFFFKRGEGDRASAELLFPTLASQLAIIIDGFDLLLKKVVKVNPQICSKSLGEQFNRLILQPLQQLPSGTGCTSYIMIIDALDECENEDDIRAVLQLLSTFPVTGSVRLRLFLTSRPELVIRLGFMRMSDGVHQDLILHEVPQPVIQHDILAFLTDALAKIWEDYNRAVNNSQIDEPLVADWPGDKALSELTNLATPLFIVAATIHRLIRDADRPQQCLESILHSRDSVYLSGVGKVYMLVLQAMTTSMKDKQDVLQMQHEFRIIVGAIITLVEPLSRTALAMLLGLKQSDVQLRLRFLHAVLQVPSDSNVPIRPLHLSFSEYLTSQQIQGTPYWIDTAAMHIVLWRRCLQLLSGTTGLRENICRLTYPGQLLSEVPSTQIDQCLQPEIRYACRYWIHHVQASGHRVGDHDEIHIFLKQHFLHWLEALSCMSRLADAIGFVTTLQSILADSEKNHVETYLEDARRFILGFRFIGEQAPLQIYSSAIGFAPQNSIIRRVHGQLPSWILQRPITPVTWGFGLQRLEGHTDAVTDLAFSPNGLQLASVSHDKTIRLWNVETGQEVQVLEGHSHHVNAVMFSPNGSILVSAGDQTVRIWDVKTGQEVQKLHGHDSKVNSVAFSPSGSLIASSGNLDDKVRLWDAKTGQPVLTLRCHTECIDTVIFSPSGSVLASAGDDTVLLWDIVTGKVIHKLVHPSPVHGIAFSPDGSTLASSGWFIQSIRLWDSRSGQEIQTPAGYKDFVRTVAFNSNDGSLLALGLNDFTLRIHDIDKDREVLKLEGHTRPVRKVVFSPSGSLLASGSFDTTIRMWDVRMAGQAQRPDKHGEPHSSYRIYAVAISPSGLLLASGSSDKLVRLWNVRTGQEVQKLAGHTGVVYTVAFSLNNSLVASGSYDKTIRLWDANTGGYVQKLEGHMGWVNMVVFSPGGSLIASGSSDKTIRLWDVATGMEVWKLEGHTSSTILVTFSPNGTLLASFGIRDRTIRLWDVGVGKELRKLKDVPDISKLEFSFDGNTLITNRGYVQTDSMSTLQPLTDSMIAGRLTVNGDWIECGGKRLLWLPQEYRSDVSIVSGTTIGLGRKDGNVTILKIKYPPD